MKRSEHVELVVLDSTVSEGFLFVVVSVNLVASFEELQELK